MKACKDSHGKSVEAVVVHVPFQEVEGADEIRCLYVVMPWSKRLQSGHNFVYPVTELHEIGVVLGSVGHTFIHPLKSGLCPTVWKIAPMVGDEGLRSISPREDLKEANNSACSFPLTIWYQSNSPRRKRVWRAGIDGLSTISVPKCLLVQTNSCVEQKYKMVCKKQSLEEPKQGHSDQSSNSRNRLHLTWSVPFSASLYMYLNEERSTRVEVCQLLCRVELVLDANLVLPHCVVSGRGLNVVVESAVHVSGTLGVM